MAITPYAATAIFPARPSMIKLNTMVVIPLAISPTNATTPRLHDFASILIEGNAGLNLMLFFFDKKCVRHIRILTIGETPVASAAPTIPNPRGNIKI